MASHTLKSLPVRRITGVKYAVEIHGKRYIAAWKSPYRVSLYERDTLKMVARHTPNSIVGNVPFDTIAKASDNGSLISMVGH